MEGFRAEKSTESLGPGKFERLKPNVIGGG